MRLVEKEISRIQRKGLESKGTYPRLEEKIRNDRGLLRFIMQRKWSARGEEYYERGWNTTATKNCTMQDSKR